MGAGSHSRFPRWLALFAFALSVSGCAEARLLSHASKQASRQTESAALVAPAKPVVGTYKVGNPYQINGVWYYPQEDPYYDQTGIASWYGLPFHGRETANGEFYDMNDLTAAHQTLPLPSIVRVTNMENGRSIVVRVNDRGPFVNGRVIDMSRRGAQLLGFEQQGTAKVRVQVVGPVNRDTAIAYSSAPSDAEDKPVMPAVPRMAVTAEALPPPPGMSGRTPVLVMPQPPPPSATALLAQVNRGTDVPPELAAPSIASPVAPSVDLTGQVIRVDLVRPSHIYVQAGAFNRYDNAYRLSAKLSPYGKARVDQKLVNGGDIFRVRLGPLANVTVADRMLSNLIAVGHPDARIVVE